jgi:hypothetical protein
MSCLIHGYIDHFRFGHPDALVRVSGSLGFNDDMHSNGCAANSDGVGIETDQVADEDRMDKSYFSHRHSHKSPITVLAGFDRASLVNVYSTRDKMKILRASGKVEFL